MDFESLKEQFIEKFLLYKNQIQESEVYIKLKERYDSLAPNVQALIKYGAIVLVVYFFYSIPSSFVSAASEKMTYFEENRQLTRDLIRAGRIAKTVKLPPAAPKSDRLKSQMEGKITREQILDTQKSSIRPLNDVASKTLVPKSIKQSGMKANLKQLTLRQMIKLGESFDQISSSKLINMAIQSDAKDPHYFNVDYEVAAFDVPRDAIDELANKGKNKKTKKGRSRSKKRKNKKSKK